MTGVAIALQFKLVTCYCKAVCATKKFYIFLDMRIAVYCRYFTTPKTGNMVMM
jgi:hypothetical protein